MGTEILCGLSRGGGWCVCVCVGLCGLSRGGGWRVCVCGGGGGGARGTMPNSAMSTVWIVLMFQ